jgi:hypothetical protein
MNLVEKGILNGEIPFGDLSPAERTSILQSLTTGQLKPQPGVEQNHILGLLLSGFFKSGSSDYRQATGILKRWHTADDVAPQVSNKHGAKMFSEIFGIKTAESLLPSDLFLQAKGQLLEDALGL